MKEKKYYVDVDKRLKKIEQTIKQDKKDIEEFDELMNKVLTKKEEDSNDNSR